MFKFHRQFIAAVVIAVLAPSAMQSAHAQEKVIKVGTLKLIHAITPHFYQQFAPPGYKIEVIPFESPTDGKNAVVTGTVDFGTFGFAAAMLGAAAGEPVVIFAPQCNGGMAVVAGAKSVALRCISIMIFTSSGFLSIISCRVAHTMLSEPIGVL